MLSAVEANGAHIIRLTLCRQLAELLLRGVTGVSYTPPMGKLIQWSILKLKDQKNPSTDIRYFLSLLFVNKVLSIQFKAPIRFLLIFIYLVLVFIKIFAFIFYLFS